MNLLLSIFKTVNLIFAFSAVITGSQAIINPISFAHSFGIPVNNPASGPIVDKDATDKSTDSSVQVDTSATGSNDSATSYVSLMGVRQLATGLTLLTFAYQNKWLESATVLAILGIVVAGTDGIYLFRTGAVAQAKFHAIPGALIALLAAAVVFTCD